MASGHKPFHSTKLWGIGSGARHIMKKLNSLTLFACLAVAPLVVAPTAFAGGSGGDDTEVGISFRNRATIKQSRRATTKYEARTAYPVFRSQSPVSRYATYRESLEARQELDDTARRFDTDTRDRTVTRRYTYRATPRLYYNSDNFVSVGRDTSYYDGTMTRSRTTNRNYGIVDGRPQRLQLGNFFRRGSDYRRVTNDRLIEKLRNQDTAPRVGDGTIRILSDEQLNNFTADRTGMTWTFNPGELGDEQLGYTQVRLNRDELGPDYEDNIFTR